MALTTMEMLEKKAPVVHAVAEAIQGLGSIPNGHLYANLMGKMNLDTYNGIIGILVKLGFIEVKHDLITWVG